MSEASAADGTEYRTQDAGSDESEGWAPRWLVAVAGYGVVVAAFGLVVASTVTHVVVGGDASGRATVLFLSTMVAVTAAATAAGGPLLLRLEGRLHQAVGSGGPPLPRRRRA